MSKLTKQQVHYGESDPESRYSRARDSWDDRENDRAKGQRLWMQSTFLLGVAVLVLTIGLVYISAQDRVQTVFVRVDRSGAPFGTEVAKQGEISIENVRWTLMTLVLNTRQLYLDSVAIKKNWDQAYAMMTPEAQRQMTQIAKEQGVADEIGKIRNGAFNRITRMVELKAFIPLVVDSNTYQLRWREKTYDGKGVLVDSKNFTGQFTVVHSRAKSVEEVFKNPLGIYVANLSIYQDLN